MQAAQTCGQIRAGGISSSGRAVLRDHPVVRRARDGNGQAKNKARPWRVVKTKAAAGLPLTTIRQALNFKRVCRLVSEMAGFDAARYLKKYR